jgi:hypothetical protein
VSIRGGVLDTTHRGSPGQRLVVAMRESHSAASQRGGRQVSVWLYQIHPIELPSGVDWDNQMQNVLREYGTRGWELVQVLDGSATGYRTYRLIFKTEKPLVGLEKTRTEAT